METNWRVRWLSKKTSWIPLSFSKTKHRPRSTWAMGQPPFLPRFSIGGGRHLAKRLERRSIGRESNAAAISAGESAYCVSNITVNGLSASATKVAIADLAATAIVHRPKMKLVRCMNRDAGDQGTSLLILSSNMWSSEVLSSSLSDVWSSWLLKARRRCHR